MRKLNTIDKKLCTSTINYSIKNWKYKIANTISMTCIDIVLWLDQKTKTN